MVREKSQTDEKDRNEQQHYGIDLLHLEGRFEGPKELTQEMENVRKSVKDSKWYPKKTGETEVRTDKGVIEIYAKLGAEETWMLNRCLVGVLEDESKEGPILSEIRTWSSTTWKNTFGSVEGSAGEDDGWRHYLANHITQWTKQSLLCNKVPISHAFRDLVDKEHVGCSELTAGGKEKSKSCAQHVKGFNEKSPKEQYTLDPANKKLIGPDLAAHFIYNNLNEFGSISSIKDDFYEVFLSTQQEQTAPVDTQIAEMRTED
uniref:Uncharacterized protein n=1 Tax=Solanum tuberosum TaxID=4113 RepID=M1CW44_SOLTU